MDSLKAKKKIWYGKLEASLDKEFGGKEPLGRWGGGVKNYLPAIAKKRKMG